MADNAIIFGAGASYDAGIPMLGTFIERMRRYALKRVDSKGNPLSENDITIFDKALDVMGAMNEYHARAAFDDRNLEDLLSILSFSLLGQGDEEKSKLDALVAAIVRTIELSCNVRHDGRLDSDNQYQVYSMYPTFWKAIFREWQKSRNVPAIITLNYDLVLERSLFQSLITRRGKLEYFPFDGLILDYKYKHLPRYCYKLVERTRKGYSSDGPYDGTVLIECEENELRNPIVIEMLKLHGSLNFPATEEERSSLAPTNVVENPLIVPPISNKLIEDEMTMVWNSALKHLREVKNLIIVGYSLPRSDVYMQFFLKSALGPNKDFDKLIVFNPILFQENSAAKEMEQRYSSCFSEQLRNYIIYHPYKDSGWQTVRAGTFDHFATLLQHKSDHGLFF